jgi:hypothetical protein
LGAGIFYRCTDRRRIGLYGNRCCGRGNCQDLVFHLSSFVLVQFGGPFVEAQLNAVEFVEAERSKKMDLLWTIAVILVILWLLGFVTSYTLGGFIHILLVLAIVVVLIRVIQGRKV